MPDGAEQRQAEAGLRLLDLLAAGLPAAARSAGGLDKVRFVLRVESAVLLGERAMHMLLRAEAMFFEGRFGVAAPQPA